MQRITKGAEPAPCPKRPSEDTVSLKPSLGLRFAALQGSLTRPSPRGQGPCWCLPLPSHHPILQMRKLRLSKVRPLRPHVEKLGPGQLSLPRGDLRHAGQKWLMGGVRAGWCSQPLSCSSLICRRSSRF